ncbi:zeta toxin family protein [Nocardiopsis exhalans]|uniref:UDP-N-acetylglucosamine kinase n=1 Tax=Nocardiopsis exhalans TaxID=163604 RepID=A0ABY5DDA1_9ACTN|nr:zeta toxin family protein [Nocardiopsis exhalans]USY21324.1 zeta toxin family protein [Nocardiopsis exhalans]
MGTDAGEGIRGLREHFLRAHEQERLRGGARRVRVLYQQLAATAEIGSPEQGDYERGVHFYLDIERTVHLLERWSRGVLLSEYPKLADELSRLIRPRPRRDLSAREHALVLERRLAALTPFEEPRREPGRRPQAIFLAGQPGAGKTSLQESIRDVLGASTAVVYHRDDNAEAHPLYAQIFEEDPFTALPEAARDLAPDLEQRCLEHLWAQRYDTVVVDPLGDRADARDLLDGFAEAGYRVAVAFVAAHSSQSLLGIADRFKRGLDHEGLGRWTESEEHQRIYDALPGVARHLESGNHAEAVYVVDRGGGVVYENHRPADGVFEPPYAAGKRLRARRDSVPTPEESEHFNDRLAHLRSRSARRNSPDGRDRPGPRNRPGTAG